MKRYILSNRQHGLKYLLHKEDETYYYHYEVVERELIEWKFPKKEFKLEGLGTFRCSKCGNRFGSETCDHCKFKKYWYKDNNGNDIYFDPMKVTEKTHYLHNELQKRDKDWINADWAKDDKIPYQYYCHNCQYFMHHHLNYCYKCGGKFYPEKLTWSEMRKKYPNYRRGF